MSTLIRLIEQGLGKKANQTTAPITAGDVPMTFADVSHAREVLGYEPKVSLASGVRHFLLWYSAYYGVRLPPEMTPTRRESAELRGKYDIGSGPDKRDVSTLNSVSPCTMCVHPRPAMSNHALRSVQARPVS